MTNSKINKENNEPWRDWEVEDWEYDLWKTRQKTDVWYQTKEERAKGAYFQLIIEEGERGKYRKNMEGTNRRKKCRKKADEEEGERRG